MKNNFLFILLIMLTHGVCAQQNDTSLIRLNRVATIEKFQFVHAFEANKDTCLLEFTKFDKDAQILFHSVDLHCIGWNNIEEKWYSYSNNRLDSFEIRRDNLPFAKSIFKYQNSADPQTTITYFTQEMDTLMSYNTFYRDDHNRLDSTVALRINNHGNKNILRTIYRYDVNNYLVQQISSDQKGEPIDMISYERLEDGKMKSIAFTTYGEKPSFKQVYYSYDQKGRIASTLDTQNRKQLYFYMKNGLLNNVLTYNGNGALEVEFLYNYSFH